MIKQMSISLALIHFGIPAIALWFATRFGVFYLNTQFGLPSVVSWFISGGLIVFLPLFIASLVAYSWEGHEWSVDTFCQRFRLQPMTRQDWGWTVGAITLIFLSTLLLLQPGQWMTDTMGLPKLQTSPSFLKMKPLTPGQYWILLAWLPFFFFNIVGEELWWRGYIQPRQELYSHQFTWLIQGTLWMMFHFSFGWSLMVLLIPILFGLPWVVQVRQNTWLGIWIHGAVNGLGFLAIALDWIPI